MTLKITPAKDAGKVLHFHHDQVNAELDHQHEVKGGSFQCDACGDAVREAQKLDAGNFAGWTVEKG